MNSQSTNKVSILKLSFIFTGFMIVVNIVANLIGTSFKTEYFLSWDYLKFEVGFEALSLFSCAVFTTLTTSKLMDFKFGTVITRILVFATVYLAIALLMQLIASLYIGSMNYFTLNFKFFNTGMRYSFLFIVVWMVLKYNQKTSIGID